MKVAIILVNYKDYAERFLPTCLASIRAMSTSVSPDIFIVDNASSQESRSYLESHAPEAKLIINFENDGFAKGNNDALRQAIEQDYDYALLLNLDTEIHPQALEELIRAAEMNPKAGAIQARLMLDPDRELVNSLGNVTHFLGFGYCLGYRDKYKEKEGLPKIAYPSGAAVLLRLSVLKEVGLFDEKFWMYNEDQDLGWRLWLQGYSCLLAPKAVVYHHYEFSRSVSKYYFMERNRLIAAWKNYSALSLLLFFPAFLIMELGTMFFALFSGWYKEKLRVWGFFLSPKNWLYLIKARKGVQSKRKVKDYQILPLFSGRIWYQEIANPVLKYIANPILSLYFKVTYLIIKKAGK